MQGPLAVVSCVPQLLPYLGGTNSLGKAGPGTWRVGLDLNCNLEVVSQGRRMRPDLANE